MNIIYNSVLKESLLTHDRVHMQYWCSSVSAWQLHVYPPGIHHQSISLVGGPER